MIGSGALDERFQNLNMKNPVFDRIEYGILFIIQHG